MPIPSTKTMEIHDLAQRRSLLPELIALHTRQIPSYQVSLGKCHLQFVYETILDHTLGKVFIALRCGCLVAFICVVNDVRRLDRLARRQTPLRQYLWALIKKPVFLMDVIDHIFFLLRFDPLHDIYLASIAVNESPQGKLAAIHLMRHVKEYALSQKKILGGLIWKHNHRAMKFYRACGFEIVKSYTSTHWISWNNKFL